MHGIIEGKDSEHVQILTPSFILIFQLNSSCVQPHLLKMSLNTHIKES
jgi:hypothetical protein